MNIPADFRPSSQARKVYKGPPPVDILVSLDIPELAEREDQ